MKVIEEAAVAVRDSLAIVIVTYNSRTEIETCLQSLVGHTQPFPTTITVVDNQSRTGRRRHVRRQVVDDRDRRRKRLRVTDQRLQARVDLLRSSCR